MNGPLSVRNVLPADPIAWINAEFESLHRQIAELRTARSGNAMNVDGDAAFGGNMTISGTLDVSGATTLDGTLTANSGTLKSGNFSAGSAGWRLQPGGNAEFNNITLRGGIIGNDALASPISAAVLNNARYNFTLPTSDADVTSASVSVPSGFSQALVIATALIGSYASGTGSTIAHVRINSTTSGGQGASGQVGEQLQATDTLAVLLTGLSGGTVTAAAQGSSLDAQASRSAATITAMVVFLR